MTVKYHIDPDRRLISMAVNGPTRQVELVKVLNTICQQPEFDPSYSLFADCRGLEPLDLNADAIERLAGHALNLSHSSKRCAAGRQ